MQRRSRKQSPLGRLDPSLEAEKASSGRGPKRAAPRRRARTTCNRRRRSARSLRERLPEPADLWRSTRQRCRRLLPAAAVGVAVALSLGGAYAGYQWLTHARRFAIQRLEIRGTETIQPEEVRRLLALPERANIFRTDMDGLEARLLASPWIRWAEVSRSFPDGLEIEIRETRAAAAVELSGLYLIDPEGQIFKRARIGAGELGELCIITGIERDEFLQSPEAITDRLRYALRAVELYQQNPDRPSLGELHLDEQHGISLITREEAIAIHLGSPRTEDMSDRFVAFDSAYQALSSEEHAAARAFRIADRTPADRVTVAFAGQ